MRINKFLSETGVCSRRQADQWIEAGRVAVNGVTAVLGTKVAAGDAVTLDGRALDVKPARVYLALNKPIGVECTTDRDVPDNIVDFVGHRERVFPIGRLDKDSEGLILLTNDGDIVNRVLRAEHEHEKEYIVVRRSAADAGIPGRHGARRARSSTPSPIPVASRRSGRNTFRIVLTQGLNRQIRRMCEYFDYTVRRLQRVRIMHIQLGSLPVGRWRNLTAAEVKPLLVPPERKRSTLSLRKKGLGVRG